MNMAKMHRTANGKQLDIEALKTKHEKTRALGNMNVNARGDEVDSKGNIVRRREEIVQQHYESQVEPKTNIKADK